MDLPLYDRRGAGQALAPYHFGHLPVWIDGNLYCNGATVSKHEGHGLRIESDVPVYVRLVETDETDDRQGDGQSQSHDQRHAIRLETNLFDLIDDQLGNFQDPIITTEFLGYAFEPEQRFENPDGTQIIFNRDCFGDHRGLTALPGPFAKAADKYVIQ